MKPRSASVKQRLASMAKRKKRKLRDTIARWTVAVAMAVTLVGYSYQGEVLTGMIAGIVVGYIGHIILGIMGVPTALGRR